jgi:O-antigen/teichoic acid export membrane protein
MRLGVNLLAGLANSICTAIVGLAVVPIYLKFLGIEAYGLIGFYATTQAVLTLLDMGMAPTINREVARYSATGNLKGVGNLLHTLSVIYWGMGSIIALLILILSPFIAEYWLHSKQLSSKTILQAVMLMGIVIACRWPIGLYQGVLIGAQRLTISSGINMSITILGSLGAVVVLAFISSTIEAFFIWQACVGLASAMVMRMAAWRILGSAEKFKFDVETLKRVWRFSAGMSGVAISSIILMQLDKLILSKILTLEDFGHYALAGVVATGLYIILTPTFNVIYPRLSVLVASNEIEKLIELYRSGTRLLLAILFPIAGVAVIFSREILLLWTGDPIIASNAGPVVSFFLIGTALNGAMHFPYALQLAYGRTQLPLRINVILVLVMIPTTIFLTTKYGAVGGSAAWMMLNGIYLFLGTTLTHRVLLKGLGVKWLLFDVGVPLGWSVLIIGGMGSIVRELECSIFIKLAICCVLVATTFFIIIMQSLHLSTGIKNIYNQYR